MGTFGSMQMKPGRVATEDQPYDPKSAGGVRGATESVLQQFARQGVRTSMVRLPPIVHGENDRNGFMPFLIKTARKNREAVYLGDGMNRWGAVQKQDAAHLYRLVLEGGVAGLAYHAVAEQGIPFRQIAERIGQGIKVPVVSKLPGEAAKEFSFLAGFVTTDNPVSSALTQERTGWKPIQPELFTDLERSGYFNS